MKLSIIIPTLNEADHLPATVERLRLSAGGFPFQLIVSDCDSIDGTCDIGRGLGATVVGGGACRADALNRGAAVAAGDTLLFLHADTDLPAGFAGRIDRALRPVDVVGGAFEFAFKPDALAGSLDRFMLRHIEFVNRFRYRYGRGFFGDQAIFVRRAVFDRIGGFPPLPLMEDLRFSQAMSRLGRTAIINPPILTSPRRFLRRGPIRQLLQDMLLLSCDSLGVRPEALWGHYNSHNRGDMTQATIAPLSLRVPLGVDRRG